MDKGKRILDGVVVSNKPDKSAVVLVNELKMHKLYKKQIKASKKFLIHDQGNLCKLGDQVEIVECRPFSKNKKFRLQKIVKTAEIII